MTVLMVGATGEFAGLVLPELKKHGVTVRALVQNEAGKSKARERGADEAAIGNLDDEQSLIQRVREPTRSFSFSRRPQRMKPGLEPIWSRRPQKQA